MPVLTFLILAVSVLVMRIVPHPWNAAPTAAAMLFAGAVFPQRWLWLAPLAGSLLADAVIGFDHWPVELVIYGSFSATWLIGRVVRAWGGNSFNRAGGVGIGSLAGSVLFFVSTNWAVWVWSGMYPASWAGLAQSYVMAVPFFKNTLAGDLLYMGVFFGGYAVFQVIARTNVWRSSLARWS